MEDLQHLIMLQSGEESIEAELDADGDGLTVVEDEACDVEHDTRANLFSLRWHSWV